MYNDNIISVLNSSVISLCSMYTNLEDVMEIEDGLCDEPFDEIMEGTKKLSIDTSRLKQEEDYEDFRHAFSPSIHVEFRKETNTYRFYSLYAIPHNKVLDGEGNTHAYEYIEEFVFAYTPEHLCIGSTFEVINFDEETIFQLKLTDAFESIEYIENILSMAKSYFELCEERNGD